MLEWRRLGVKQSTYSATPLLGNADLRVGQIHKNRPLAGFEYLGLEARLPAFGLGSAVALAAAAMGEVGVGVAEQDFGRVAPVLVAAVGVHNQAQGGPLGEQGEQQGNTLCFPVLPDPLRCPRFLV